jgi:phage terminase small subunit
MALTEQKKRFADKYFETLKGSESAIYAGYSEATARQIAYNLLQEPEVEQYLSGLRAEYAEKSGISKQWIIERFKTISDRCIQEEPVFDSKGEPTGEFRFDSSGANNATAHLGKIIGVFEKDNEQRKDFIQINIDNQDAKLGE